MGTALAISWLYSITPAVHSFDDAQQNNSPEAKQHKESSKESSLRIKVDENARQYTFYRGNAASWLKTHVTLVVPSIHNMALRPLQPEGKQAADHQAPLRGVHRR